MNTTLEDATLTDGDFRRVATAVYKHCGISLNDSKRDLVRARLAKEVRVSGSASPAAYLDRVLAAPGGPAFTAFIDAISTNLTSFYRESDHFDYLSDKYLPALFARKRKAGDGRLLAWCAACSSGEEAYTLGMTFAEAARATPRGTGTWDVRILASDISTRVLKVAEAGVYPEARLAGVPADYRDRYFRPTAADEGDGRRRPAAGSRPTPSFEVAPGLREAIRFRHLNLMDAWPFKGPFDVIFCRNVMIYFDKQTQERLVGRFFDVLQPGGMLFTGHSESLTGIAHRFANRGPSVYEKP